MPASRIVDQVAALRRSHPEAPLVLFVPRVQLGSAVEAAVARRDGGWRGLRATIPRTYAEKVASADVFASGRRQAPVDGRLFRAARLLKERPEREGDPTALPTWHLLALTVAEAIETLRLGGASVESVERRRQARGAGETLGVVVDSYRRYTDELHREGLYDDATLFQWAADRVRSGEAPDVEATVYAVIGAADLSERAADFLDALRDHARAFVRIGATAASGGRPLAPPPASAAALFAGCPRPEVASRSGVEPAPAAAEQRFVRAVGVQAEVRSVLRDVLRRGLSFDDVEIAFASERPYASLIADEAELLGDGDAPPLTLGTGVPAPHTRPGRALSGFFEWVREGFDPAVLVRLLRSRVVRTDRWLRREAPLHSVGRADPVREALAEVGTSFDAVGPADLRPHRAATLLASRSYAAGREGLLEGLRRALGAAVEEIGPAATGDTAGRQAVEAALLYGWVRDLARLLPRTGTVQTFATGARTFVEVFGPVDRPDRPEEERTIDESARSVLYERIQKLESLPVDCRGTAGEMVGLLRRWLERQKVAAQRHRPGRMHALPLESAGYSDRRHLYVVGLDSTTFGAAGPETGVLKEDDRRALTRSGEGGESGEGEEGARPAEEALWRAVRALRRHRGPATFCTRVFDVEAGEERDPSSLFLQMEREAEEDESADVDSANANSAGPGDRPVVGLVPPAGAPEAAGSGGVDPEADAPLLLSDAELWLQAVRGVPAASATENDPETARDVLAAAYPWIRNGEQARKARASGRYTEHDGLLAGGPHPSLDLLGDRPSGGALSASRLETLAETPYLYFLKYVLDVRPLDEPALDDEPWFDALRRGSMLHAIYERYVKRLKAEGEAASLEHRDALADIVDDVLAEEVEASAPPSEFAEAAARRELRSDAGTFLRAEAAREDGRTPAALELGFGFSGRRRRAGDYDDPARLTVDGRPLLLRGRIDRIDRHPGTGALALWDYKTGGTSSFDEDDPLQSGKTLQWALYAQAVEALAGADVEASGYFFASAGEVGERIAFSPAEHRPETKALLKRLAALARSGTFPVAPTLHKINRWKWEDYARLFQDLGARRDELKDKDWLDDRPAVPSF
jgi:RecB family exonuclease